ncbi:MAG: PhnD/SsuA/transferrin family substrate-binding protein [Elusimicrobia bacterium]|nr:PhnD/SsuA/transferrin family substrate-binding protein [Elusimicrobiota bacterium]
MFDTGINRQAVYKSAAFCILTALVLAGCARRKEATVGTPGNPLVVLLSAPYIPSDSRKSLDFIERYLSTNTAMSVEVRTAEDSVDAIEQFGAKKADAGILTLDEYLVAREEHAVHADLQVLRGKGASKYEGVILVRAEDKIKDVSGLAGKKISFSNPYSVSGFLLPSIYLKKAGVQILPGFAASHDVSIQKLIQGEVDAAATYYNMALRNPKLRILAKTGTVPNEPVIARNGLLPAKRKAIMAAFETLGNTPEGRDALSHIADITGFVPVKEESYRQTHELILSAGKSVYDLLPEGWHIQRLNQPYFPADR